MIRQSLEAIRKKMLYVLAIGFMSYCNAQSCPSMTVPMAGDTDVSVNTEIKWNEVEGASGYYLLVGTTPGGRDLVDRVDVGNNTTYELPEGESYPANTLISVKVTIRFPDRPDQTCPYELFTTGNAESEQGCGHFINQILDFTTCDADGDNSEEFSFDLADLENRLIGNQSGLTVTYHEPNGNPLDLGAGSLLVMNERTILARATNTLDCSEETSFKLVVLPQPKVNVLDNSAHCESFTLPTIPGEGNYFTQSEGSGTPLFEGDLVTESQRIYIFAKIGDCQDESSFEVTIDKGICEENVDDACNLIFPVFFTPNNDGFNDNFKLLESDCAVNGVVYIYDRYGKLLKQFDVSNGFWDGQFNSRIVPETDYWYKFVNLDSGSALTGHFTLKR